MEPAVWTKKEFGHKANGGVDGRTVGVNQTTGVVNAYLCDSYLGPGQVERADVGAERVPPQALLREPHAHVFSTHVAHSLPSGETSQGGGAAGGTRWDHL
eukprot:446850-Prorocentrum_minimum.AAC.1